MSEFTLHTPDTAPAAARNLLLGAQKQLGFVPNLYAHLANAPAALEAYFGLSAQFDKTSFNPIERQVVLLAASVENGCEFCVAAHSVIARKMAKAPDAVVDALRNRTILPDTRLEALAQFTRSMVKERGWVAGAPLQAFRKAGFTHQQALEVVLGVTMKTLSNYANHLTGTETNEQFAGEAWKRPA
ncbi:MAG TPA: carboxymuconolactone decarboxylase family protein [Rhodanobacter sp.]|nr:carboxymuconolactone decarboxylase family protein [Rhodanobacter sp.]